MKPSLTLIVTLTMLLVVMITGCDKNLDTPLLQQDQIYSGISLSEVRDWYQKSSNNPNGRIATKSNKVPLWDFNESGKFENGRPFVVVTLAYPKEEFLRADASDQPLREFEDKTNVNEGLIRKALFFKDTKGQFQKYVLYIIPDKEYSKKVKDSRKKRINSYDFSGLVLVRDWDTETFIDGWKQSKGKFISQVVLSSSQSTKNSTGRVASGFCSYTTYGVMDCVQVPCPQPANIINNATARMGTFSVGCVSCSWTTTGSDGYCEGDGSTTFTGQIGANGGGGGISPVFATGTNLNQAMANLVSTYSAQLTTSEEAYILDCDDLDEAESLTRALRLWANLDISQLEALAGSYMEFEVVNAAERQILEQINGIILYKLTLLRYVLDAMDSDAQAAANFKNGTVNGQPASMCSQCIGNAFKHAIFRILNAASFGVNRSVQLGDAHESGQAPPQLIDRNMDIYNNGKGIEVFNGRMPEWTACNLMCRARMLPAWVSDLNDRIITGDLKYIRKDPNHSDDASETDNDQSFDEMVGTNLPGISRY